MHSSRTIRSCEPEVAVALAPFLDPQPATSGRIPGSFGIMKRIVRFTVWGAVGVAALFTLLTVTVGVTFYRPVPIDNDPLTNSIAVTSVSSNRLTLADGRVLEMLGWETERLSQDMRDSGGRVELESPDSRFASVYVKRKRFICGTYAPRVVIPLLRTEYAAYYRHPLGLGEFQ